MAGKGDTRRPMVIDVKTFEENWRRIFSSGSEEKEDDDGENSIRTS